MEKTILVVDDDPTILMIVEMILKKHYHVITAKSGLECLANLSQFHVDLLLLDIIMPFMDGFQTLEKIRSDPKNRDIPVIFLTGEAGVETVTQAKEKDVRDYILKPPKEQYLLEKVKRALA